MCTEYEKLKNQIELAVELIEKKTEEHSGHNTNVDFHSGVTYALGYAIGVLPNEFKKQKVEENI